MRRPPPDEKRISKLISSGRGRGEGSSYLPWLEVRDVPSRGKSSRPYGTKTGRKHVLLSRLELYYFYILEWSPVVSDIREQYPLLPLRKTLELSELAGIRHPHHNASGRDVVMTTDFLLTKSDGSLQARTVKYTNDLKKRRSLEKLELERLYWLDRKIDYKIVTERTINTTLARNVEWILAKKTKSSLEPLCNADIDAIRSRLQPNIAETTNTPLALWCSDADSHCGYPPGSALAVARHLLALKEWSAEIHEKKINPTLPVPLVAKVS
ncbi:TnsA endonuclease N-terminal domain-containing protein [Pelagicoccus sp. SDUM812005]|uniref:TnsA endonuclease N-terminal domain-containing protein n=1 Tax=Pelagicoccus sp. SDUM812005 TaxID=3041257 RepID=UPI002810221A|nr:TnsA endonuclease N-terminal domain-containing protein [Pelagicoccus sp. SDUM812005]MDQ8181888.1 TnsA endonuclease N-terminal domain-containing protein [Pelagicoccus sp. SDUM812005]